MGGKQKLRSDKRKRNTAAAPKKKSAALKRKLPYGIIGVLLFISFAQQLQQERTNSTSPVKANLSPVINETWHPSDEWVQNCTKDILLQSEAEGEWDVPYYAVIGDCIKFCNCGTNKKNYKEGFSHLYKTRECPLTDGQFNLSKIDEIHEIQSHYTNFTSPEPDVLVVHLRLGDIIETSKASVEEMLISGADPGWKPRNYIMGIKSIREILNNIHSSGAKKVYIVGGSHSKQHWRKSRVYAGCLHRAIQFAGYSTTMRLEGIATDIDFFFVSHARQLVVSVGGYSNLMGKLVEYRGGRLVGRSFSVDWKGPSDYKDNNISKKELNSSKNRRRLSQTQD